MVVLGINNEAYYTMLASLKKKKKSGCVLGWILFLFFLFYIYNYMIFELLYLFSMLLD